MKFAGQAMTLFKLQMLPREKRKKNARKGAVRKTVIINHNYAIL